MLLLRLEVSEKGIKHNNVTRLRSVSLQALVMSAMKSKYCKHSGILKLHSAVLG